MGDGVDRFHHPDCVSTLDPRLLIAVRLVYRWHSLGVSANGPNGASANITTCQRRHTQWH